MEPMLFLTLMIQLAIQVLLPAFFLIQIWRSNLKNFWEWLIRALFVGAYLYDLFLVGFWPFGAGYPFRYILWVAFAICVLRSILNPKVERKTKRNRRIFSFAFYLLMLCVFSWDIVAALDGSKKPGGCIALDFPLKNGTYYVMQGGDNAIINHHYPVSAQRYALDIVQLNTLGLRSKGLLPSKLDEYNIFDALVYSPCTGTILEAVDSRDDQTPLHFDPERPVGNYIALKKQGADAVIILAHLKKGSLTVQEGDFIQQGDLIARVGNSGNTSEPHLHIHCIIEGSGDLLFSGKGIPMTFDGRFLVKNDIVKK